MHLYHETKNDDQNQNRETKTYDKVDCSSLYIRISSSLTSVDTLKLENRPQATSKTYKFHWLLSIKVRGIFHATILLR